MAEDHDPNDRFGVPDQLIKNIIKAHAGGILHAGCYVPTRHQVATLKPWPLVWMILGWWWESPSELIPTDEQVAACVEILRARPDADSRAIQDLIVQAPPPAGIDPDHGADAGQTDA